MIKKVIITLLIIVILASLGVIGYIILSQNPNLNLNLAKFWPFSLKVTEVTPKVPTNFFPQATSTLDQNWANNQAGSSSPIATIVSQPTTDNPNLAGASALGLDSIKGAKGTRVLFIDRPMGNLYEISPQNELIRLTNETITDVGEAYWGKDKAGDHVILRQNTSGQIVNLNGIIKTTATNNELDKLSLQTLSPNILALAVSPDKTRFFTIEKNGTGVIGYLNDWAGKNKKKIWSFLFSDWQVAWPSPDVISLTTRPSANDSGYLYFLNPTTGTLTKILNGVNGLLTNTSPDGKRVIYSRSNLKSFNLYVYDLVSKKTNSLSLNTLPEKCYWTDPITLYCAVPRKIPAGNYPDTWYQGKTTLADDIWKIDVKQNTVSLLVQIKGSYDLINLVATPERGWIYAINKPDNSIQSFALPIN